MRARVPRAARAVGRVPHTRWERATVVASLSTTGRGAAMVLAGALARESVAAFVEHRLVPTLVPGQIVVLDHRPVHTSAWARTLIAGAGAPVVFRPASSPNCPPIALAFSKLEQLLRGAAERTLAGSVAATGPTLDAVTAADARGFFAHCRYHLSGQLL